MLTSLGFPPSGSTRKDNHLESSFQKETVKYGRGKGVGGGVAELFKERALVSENSRAGCGNANSHNTNSHYHLQAL